MHIIRKAFIASIAAPLLAVLSFAMPTEAQASPSRDDGYSYIVDLGDGCKERQYRNGTERLRCPKRQVEHTELRKVTPVKHGAVRVRFNNGSVWLFAPCRNEDSNHCYWDAQERGNGFGDSFVTLRKRTWWLNDHRH